MNLKLNNFNSIGNDYAIVVKNLSKRFSKSPIRTMLNELTGKIQKKESDFQALNNISFKIKKGESIGLLGENGSGKSTLLQIIANTLQPTSGIITTNGKLAALLELGSGFNLEFSGLENIFLNASILGFDRRKTSKILDNIIRFADVGDFIEQPVKVYSSGMRMRLAFAVQVHVKPEILIIDEALGVGDQNFRLKCYNKINELIKDQVTFLLVSHNQEILCNLTSRTIVVDKGSIVFDSDTPSSVDFYNNLINKNNFNPSIHNSKSELFSFVNNKGKEITKFNESEDILVLIKLGLFYKNINIIIRNKQKILIYEKVFIIDDSEAKKSQFSIKFKGCLARNIYSLQILVCESLGTKYKDLGTKYFEIFALTDKIHYKGICDVDASIN